MLSNSSTDKQNTAIELAAEFTGEFGYESWGRVAMKTYYSLSNTSDRNIRAAREAIRQYGPAGYLLANPLAGLNCCLSDHDDLMNILGEQPLPSKKEQCTETQQMQDCLKNNRFILEEMHFLQRMLYSCLTDAIKLSCESDRDIRLRTKAQPLYNCCVISFLDEYGKIQNEIRNRTMRKPTMPEINAMAKSFAGTAAKTELRIQTCAERGYDLTKYGIHEGPCVDADYIETLIGEKLPSYIRKTDSFRRCDCAVNTDIGTYHRCQHDCKYCYAK